MKSFMCILLLTILTSSLMGCDSVQRIIGSAVPKAKALAAKKLTAAIVKVGECSASDQVLIDVQSLLKLESDNGLITKAVGSEAPEGAQEEGVISKICKTAASLALPALLQKGVPQKWNCQLTELNSKLGELSDKACGKIPM